MHARTFTALGFVAAALAGGTACDDSLLGGGSVDTGISPTGGGYCAVQATFDADCTSCHSPGGGLQGGLDLQTDAQTALVGVASQYPGRTLVVAGDPASSFLLTKLHGDQLAGEGSAMPIGNPLSTARIDAISAWIASGATTDCGGGDTDTGQPPVCNDDNESCRPGTCGGEGSNMLPGADCLSCHKPNGAEDAPTWTAAGTAFTDQYGTDPLRNATIEIVDHNNSTIRLTTNSVGNFYTRQAIAMPFTASITTANGTSEMTAHQDTGACNSCHQCDGEAGGKLYGN